MRTTNRAYFICFNFLLIIYGCATSDHQYNNYAETTTIDKKLNATNINIASEQISSIQDVTLGPGDEIEVKVFFFDSLTTDITLNKSGVFTLPLIGDVVYANKGILNLRDEIQNRYSKYLINPQVAINITAINSQKAIVLGQVGTPKVISLTTEMTISEAIANAGGVKTSANTQNILLVRKNNNKINVTKYDFEAIAQGVEPSKDSLIQNKDIIFVPESWISITANYMSNIATILSPIIALEGGIVLFPDAKNVILGTSSPSDIQPSLPIGGN